ncbi:MAG: 1-(5-phosphoribosyl)-5-[(5-phosphoribosylamino)methylideneamino]imidazole-4-carboxamide isomerase [Tidjanibacter sp.]|nr:1-(5-phosphoribosyl)-5-[(5-phosphoribosylamino)methylideneamino]imidazole-4-carboxamide isomerase [Tidjanibacter sp.]
MIERKIELIPAIDIIGGECVRLSQGDYDAKTVYYKSPIDAAMMFADAGVKRIHVVDLDGAKESMPRNLTVVERVVTRTGLDVEFGGGVKSDVALRDVFNSGVKYAICGSIAVQKPELFEGWLMAFGAERMVLGADVKSGFVATHGWLETSQVTLEEIIDRFAPAGLSQVVCTDISKDGMLSGVNEEMYDALQRRYEGIDITVSGGIGCMDDVERLNALGLRKVIIGKAFYEGRITVGQISEWMR